MKIASVADVKANFSAYIKASEAELVVITKNGKPVAVLLPTEDDAEVERLALAYSRRFQQILHQARQQIDVQAGIEHEAFWQSIDHTSQAESSEPQAYILGLLYDIGMKVFVDYYHIFADQKLSAQDMVAALPDQYTKKSRTSRVSKARRIMREHHVQEALRLIADADGIEQATRDQALALLAQS